MSITSSEIIGTDVVVIGDPDPFDRLVLVRFAEMANVVQQRGEHLSVSGIGLPSELGRLKGVVDLRDDFAMVSLSDRALEQGDHLVGDLLRSFNLRSRVARGIRGAPPFG
jgi:hypothetical protein